MSLQRAPIRVPFFIFRTYFDLVIGTVFPEDRGVSSEHFSPQTTFRLSIFHLVVFSAGVLVSLFGFLWFRERQSQFPRISPGMYVGFIDGIVPQKRIPLLIIREGAKKLTMVPLIEDLQPVMVTIPEEGSSHDLHSKLPPVLYAYNGMELQLIGQEMEGRFQGTVVDQRTGKTGTWYVLKENLGSKDEASTQVPRQWLAVYSEKERLKADNALLKEQAALKIEERRKIDSYIVDGKQLKENADRKFKEESVTLDEIAIRAKKRSSEIEKLRAQVSLAQQLSHSGRLAQLAREAMNREQRWFLESIRE